MSAKTIVITGANRGIGLAIARIYRGRGDRVTALCRRASDDLRDCGAEIVEDVDVTSSQALQRAATVVENVDVLIANAGVQLPACQRRRVALVIAGAFQQRCCEYLAFNKSLRRGPRRA
jgi:NAD(P)-dependent dehydrogenase (short-subunit alcohol dehydrogenase family)